MLDWIREHSSVCFLIAAGVAFLATCWLALRTGLRGGAGVFADVLLPSILAGATLYLLPQLMAAFGLPTTRYERALEGLFFRSLWLGFLLDQTSWVQRTTTGLRGRRAALPVFIWGLGLVVLILAPNVASGQHGFLSEVERGMENPDLRDLPINQLPWLLTDWGRMTAYWGISMTLVGSIALAVQALLCLVRIGHAYLLTQAVPPEETARPPHAPGCFQWLFGFVVGTCGAIWLIWATASLLQQSLSN